MIETLGAGGAERALVNIASALSERVGRLDVAVLRPPYALQRELEEAGVAVHRLDLGDPWQLPSGVAKLSRLLRRHEFNIVHGHLFFGAVHASIAGTLARGVSRVVSFHNLGYASYPPKTIPQRARKMLERALMRNLTDGRVAVSHAVAEHYCQHLKLTDVMVIPNALSQDLVISASRGTIGRRRDPKAPPTIILPGRFVPEKGHTVLLHATCVLEREFPDIAIVLAGQGPVETEVRREVEQLKLSGRVQFTGRISHQKLLDLERTADVVVVPSLYEGFGLAACEAMAVGTPVVASKVGGLLELIDDPLTGRLARPGSAEDLASVIRSVLLDKESTASMAARAQSYVAEHFTPAIVATQTADFYGQLAGDGRANRPRRHRFGKGHVAKCAG